MNERYVASRNYVLRKVAGRSILVSVGQEIADFCGVVTLNDSAVVLWELLKKGTTKDELTEALKEKFSITQEQAEADVEKSLELLLEHRMVTNE